MCKRTYFGTLDIWIQPDCLNICQETTAQTSSRFCVCGFAARLWHLVDMTGITITVDSKWSPPRSSCITLCTVGCILWAVMLSVYIIKSVHTCSESDLLWPGSGRLGSAALPQTPKHLSPSPRRVRWRDMRPRAALESSSRHTSDPCTRSPLLQGS